MKNSVTASTKDPIQALAAWIKEHGPIPAARVSSAGCVRTRIGGFAYYGVARYAIVIKDGVPVARCTAGAPRARRSRRLAERDAQQVCAEEHRVLINARGPLTEEECADVLRRLRKSS